MSDTLTRDRATLRMELQSVADQAEALRWVDGSGVAIARQIDGLLKLVAALATIQQEQA